MLRQSPLAACVRVTLSAVLLFLASTPVTARGQSSDDFVPVTDAMLQDPAPEDWLMWRRTLRGSVSARGSAGTLTHRRRRA